jgi:hypothetical protein
MSTPNIDGLKKILKREELDDLSRKLDKYPECFNDWKHRTKEDWEKYYQLAGIDIYNYLNPRREGVDI